MKLITDKLKILIEFFLPAQCLLCHLKSHNKLICSYCKNDLVKPRTCCLYCGCSLIKNQDFCGDCLTKNYLFTKLYAVADYDEPYSSLIKGLKYNKDLLCGELLGFLLSNSICANYSKSNLEKIDYIIPVPLHRKKIIKRGFNQAKIIADVVATDHNITLLTNMIIRKKNTLVQEDLTRAKRIKNLKNAFAFNNNSKIDLNGSYIVIIDDVVTTGATVNSLCETLQGQGVARVDVWCVCRTGIK